MPNEVTDQVITALAQETKEYQKAKLQEWTIDIYRWINKARIYIKTEEDLLNKLSKKTFASINEVSEMYKNLRLAKQYINNQLILTEGYTLLNTIGEKIRGEEILYSITMSKTGAALSAGSAATGGVITWRVPLQEFLTLLTFSSRRIMLKKSSTLYKMAEKIMSQNTNSDAFEKWSEEKLASFALFNMQIRRWSQWANVNEGNALEAFFRFCGKDLSIRNVEYSENSEYWRSLYNVMYSTMKKPDKFFVGGDIGNEQIKGLSASVTNLDTLIQNLTEVLQILSKTSNVDEVLSKRVRKNFTQKFQEQQNKTIEEVIEELTKFFSSQVSR